MSRESHRPRFHYTPERNWLNDPNGLIWYEGEYHLFYQYNPLGTAWGNMSWGHAVSPDLLRWSELPIAIEHTPDEHVYSGNVVLDRGNTSGFGRDGVPAMVAIYTAADPHTGRQAQGRRNSVIGAPSVTCRCAWRNEAAGRPLPRRLRPRRTDPPG